MATARRLRLAGAAKAAAPPAERPSFTDAQLDKAEQLRAEGVPWDGPEGVCAAIGAKSAIPVRRALREKGGRHAAIVPPRPRPASTSEEA
jgi:hypothetical protein